MLYWVWNIFLRLCPLWRLCTRSVSLCEVLEQICSLLFLEQFTLLVVSHLLYARKENCLLSGTMLIVCIEILSSTGLSRSHQETAMSNCEIGTAYRLWKVVNGAHYLSLYVLQQQWHVVSLLLHLFEVLCCQKLMQTYVGHVLCYLYRDHHIINLLNLL